MTVITKSHVDNDLFAVGFEDGRIRVWDFKTATVIVSFNGHKSAVTQLRFDDSGARLASGSKDTDIVLWDLVAEIGLFKLRGHKDQITSLHFLGYSKSASGDAKNLVNGHSAPAYPSNQPGESGGFLLTTSKDALIKIWDLSSQFCIETHVAQNNGECWSLGLSPDQSGCITAGNDGELRAWSINSAALAQAAKDRADSPSPKVLVDRGSFYRHGKDRTIGINFHPRRDYVALHGSDKAIELWRVRSEGEIQKSLARKRKRRREKIVGDPDDKGKEVVDDLNDKNQEASSALITEVFVPYVIVRTGGKPRSMDWADKESGKSLAFLTATTNNQIEVYEVAALEKKSGHGEQPEYRRDFTVDMPGHRSDIRSLALSSDDRMLASASNGSLKVWNVRTQTSLRTLDCGYALCCAFLPGDKIVIVGTKEGTIELHDIASSTLLDSLNAHEREVWSLHVHPEGKSLVTGSADKSAKFWEFKIVQEEVLGTTRKNPKLSLAHTRTLKLSDDVLSIRFSPDSRLLALSTLDNTVKVFFVDTLKLYLTLYGHKLPVLSMDISYDSKLLVSSSADKNVRVWGLDFGDCHKAFFAHQDSILSVAFVPNNHDGKGHQFFSASKDRVIKYYDGDKFEQIQKLEGHHGEIWALAIAHSGEFLVSASHDQSIRIWQQTDEQIFLEEERERELEELYENTLLTTLDRDDRDGDGDREHNEVVAASKQTVETLMAGEKIAEALELGMEDLELMKQHDTTRLANPRTVPPQRNPVFLAQQSNISASSYVLSTFQRIPSAALQDALLVLPFSQLPALFTFLAIWAVEGRNVSLTCRILFFLLKTHQKQLSSSQLLRPVLEEVRGNLKLTIRAQTRQIGFNLAGVRILGRRVGDLAESDYVDEELFEEEEKNKKKMDTGKKRAFINVA